MREGRAEVGSVDGGVAAGLWGVDVFAAGAKELDGMVAGNVGQADGDEGVGAAEDAGTAAKVEFLVFLELFAQSASLPPARTTNSPSSPTPDS